VLDRVDHQRHRCAVADEPLESRTVGRRVADDEVVEAVIRQPERLRQCERQDAVEPWHAVKDAPLECAAAHRFAREPQWRAVRAAHEIGGVRVEGVEVDAGERRRQLRARALEPLVLVESHRQTVGRAARERKHRSRPD
jgi:hypothetical protein